MEEKPNYYAIIPAAVRYNDKLNSSQKLFYAEITSLTKITGECWASNNYFSQLYSVSPSSISNWVKKLERENLIEVSYIKKGKEIEKRIIRLKGIQNIDYLFNKLEEGIQNIEEGYSKNLKENNKNNNNKNINNIRKFTKPSFEELHSYIEENNLNVDTQNFLDYYESNGWKVGHNAMKDWKATARRWSRTNKDKVSNRPTWLDKNIQREETSQEEFEEMESLLKDFQ